MNIVLAMAWRPNERDITRFKRLLPIIHELYCGVSIVMPPDSQYEHIAEIKSNAHVKLLISGRGENRRYLTIRQALEFAQADYVHYCDGDHVVSRMEKHLADWKQMLNAISNAECLIIERSQTIFDSYPRPLRETEQIINAVGSYMLGQSVDLGSGSRILSRNAVEFLIKYASSNLHGVTTDLEWLILLQRAGFRIETTISEGAIYEIASESQRQQLESVAQWAARTEIARMIIQTGIDAARRSDLPKLSSAT
jgi:hypothetical protein